MQDDMALLQGRWKQTGFEENGVPDAPDLHGDSEGSITTFHGNHFAVRSGDVLLLEGHFELDQTATPKAVTWTDTMGPDTGKPLPAIYELDKDSFVFVAADAGAARPRNFRWRSRADKTKLHPLEIEKGPRRYLHGPLPTKFRGD